MTQYELLDLAQSAYGNSMAAYALHLTVLTGYLITAYLVGAALTRTQVVILTSLFLYVIAMTTWSTSAYVYWGITYSALSQADYASATMMSPQPWLPTALAVMNGLIVFACLYFMWSMRRRKNEYES